MKRQQQSFHELAAEEEETDSSGASFRKRSRPLDPVIIVNDLPNPIVANLSLQTDENNAIGEAEKEKLVLQLKDVETERCQIVQSDDAELNAMKDEVEVIRQQMFCHRNDMDQAKFEVEKLEEDLAKAKIQMAEKDLQIAELLQMKQVIVDGRVDEIINERIDKSVDGTVGGRLDESSDLIESQAEVVKLRAKFDLLETQLKLKSEGFLKAQNDLKEKESNIDELFQQKQALIDQISYKNIEIGRIKANFAVFEAEMNSEKENSALKFQDSESRNESLSIKNAKLIAEVETLQKEVEESKNDVEDLQKRIKEESENCKAYILKFSEISVEAKTKAAEILKLKKEIEETQKSYKIVEQQIYDANLKTQKLEAELVESQKSVKEKQSEIFELQNRQTSQQKFYHVQLQKAEDKATKMENELSQSRQKIRSMEKELEHWKSKSGNLQSQLQRAEISKAEEKENHSKIVKELGGKNAELAKANAKIKSANQKVEKEFGEFRMAAKNKTSEVQKVLNESFTKINKALSSSSSVGCNDGTTTTTTTFADTRGPKWIVSKEICQDIFKITNGRLQEFLKQYTSNLFTRVEMLLSEKKLDQIKWKEAKAVLFHFFKPNGQKEIYVSALKSEMQTKRFHTRSVVYKECSSNLAIGITDTEKRCYYQLQEGCGGDNPRWIPFADKKCEIPLKHNFMDISPFAYPIEYSYSYLVIVQYSPQEGYSVHRMAPSGLFQDIFKKAAASGEKKASKK